VTYMNSSAQTLTGWTGDEASGQALVDVFRIVNEKTRQTVENPAALVMRSGRKLPRQVDHSTGDCPGDVGLGRNVSGGTRPRLSWGRS
jgi:PAS domain-containing protein